MTVTLQLKPEIEQRVLADAAARGVSVETYLTSLIEEGALPGLEQISLEEFETDMDLLAEASAASGSRSPKPIGVPDY